MRFIPAVFVISERLGKVGLGQKPYGQKVLLTMVVQLIEHRVSGWLDGG
jgi:hypothetical protein